MLFFFFDGFQLSFLLNFGLLVTKLSTVFLRNNHKTILIISNYHWPVLSYGKSLQLLNMQIVIYQLVVSGNPNTALGWWR